MEDNLSHAFDSGGLASVPGMGAVGRVLLATGLAGASVGAIRSSLRGKPSAAEAVEERE